MNSSEVAKHLGVSTSTVQRWVKQLNLPMERNERGHYTFKEEDLPFWRKSGIKYRMAPFSRTSRRSRRTIRGKVPLKR